MELTLKQVVQLATSAHAGQVDLIGEPYAEHLRAVAYALEPYGAPLQMAGWLHDVIEDTAWTAHGLTAEGVPSGVVRTVQRVTRTPERGSYLDVIRDIATDRDATLVKIADNAHNSRADRAAALDDERRKRLARRYAEARSILWPAVAANDLVTILARVNPALLNELES